MKTSLKNILCTCLFLCFSNFASATLFNVSFTDNDGPQWTGVVDSTADTLTIQTWVEGAGGTAYWTPTSPVLTFTSYFCPVFNCTFAGLSLFDVPDNWDGTIGANWGFLSDLTKDVIAWNEGVFTANSSRLGWGFSQANSEIITDSFPSEFEFEFVPYNATSNSLTTADSLSVTSTAVSEPGTIVLLGMALVGMGFSRRKKK